MSKIIKRKQRKYSLFSIQLVNGREQYFRLSGMALYKDQATKFWQDALLSPRLDGQLRKLRPVEGVENHDCHACCNC